MSNWVAVGDLRIVVVAAIAAVCATSAGCTSSPAEPKPRTASSPSPSDHSQPTLRLAVAYGNGSLALYQVAGSGHNAELVRRFDSPSLRAQVRAVSVSGVSDPAACATWKSGERSQLVCYRLDASHGEVIAAAADAGAVAISVDGSRIAWTDHPDAERQNIVVAELRSGSVTGVRRWTPDTSCTSDPCTVFSQPTGLAWAGDNALIIDVATQDDEGPGLIRLPLTTQSQRQGWLRGGRVLQPPERDQQAGWRDYDGVVSSLPAASSPILAIERPSENGPTGSTHGRGVRILPETSQPVVFARALPGRDVVSISGGSRGVAYETTRGYGPPNPGFRGGERFYLALPGETVGQPLTGLPDAPWLVVAQPS